MEEAGILDRNNNMHFSALRYVFPLRINRAVELLKEALEGGGGGYFLIRG